jgi:hypothetical protein
VLKRCCNLAFFNILRQIQPIFEPKRPTTPKSTNTDNEKTYVNGDAEEDEQATQKPKISIPMANLLPHVKNMLEYIFDTNGGHSSASSQFDPASMFSTAFPASPSFLEAVAENKQLMDYSFEILTAREQT